MGGGLASACAIAGLAEALAARGIALDPDAAATLVRCGGDPVATIRTFRRLGPIILLVRDAEATVAALDAGADDALLVSAMPQEIAARVAARLRASAPPLGVGELLIDRLARRVTRAGRAIALLPREYALLLHLAQHAGQTVPRAALLEAVWGLRFDPGTNVVAVHVSRLRAKLDHGFPAPMLRTDKGIGYRLAAA